MYTRFGKRMFDIIAAIVAAVLTSWLVVVIFIFYFLSGSTTIFFIQNRIGRHQKPFTLFKFRTLKPGPDLPIEERRFWLGDFLRFTSLDELPQLYNVLTGSMSFVGPRPLPMEYQALFSEQQQLRHSVRPGITGLAQVNGRHSISWQKKFEYDNYYVNHVGMMLDVKIMLKTFILLLSFKKDRSLDEEKFTGNTQT